MADEEEWRSRPYSLQIRSRRYQYTIDRLMYEPWMLNSSNDGANQSDQTWKQRCHAWDVRVSRTIRCRIGLTDSVETISGFVPTCSKECCMLLCPEQNQTSPASTLSSWMTHPSTVAVMVKGPGPGNGLNSAVQVAEPSGSAINQNRSLNTWFQNRPTYIVSYLQF